MSRGWRPLIVGGVIVVATFALAQAQVFEPSAPSSSELVGDATSGAAVFASECASCHGENATGGVGPALRGAGLDAATVAAVVESGRGVMPAGLVSGQEQADVVAYVVSVSASSE